MQKNRSSDRTSRPAALKFIAAGVLGFGASIACAQSTASTHSWHFFGSAESTVDSGDAKRKDLELGEFSVFGTGSISKRFSYLSETTFRASRYRDQEVVVERLSMQYELGQNTYFSLGKIHNPVNYWNDALHHGRIFFPTINRPLSMITFIPLHEIAARVGARNLGNHGAFYDVVLGSGQQAVEANDPFANGIKSFTAMAGFKPAADITIQAALLSEKDLDHTALAAHKAAHGGATMIMEMPMTGMQSENENDYDVASVSIHFDNDSFESLTEMSISKFRSYASNFALYSYAGLKVRDALTAYGFVDATHVREAFHFTKGNEYRYGVGLNYFPAAGLSLKTELMNWSKMSQDDIVLQFQLSAGF